MAFAQVFKLCYRINSFFMCMCTIALNLNLVLNVSCNNVNDVNEFCDVMENLYKLFKKCQTVGHAAADCREQKYLLEKDLHGSMVFKKLCR